MTATLPSPFDTGAGAGTEYGRRYIGWTLLEPGEMHRNAYTAAWIQVEELEPWRGEPLRLVASRRLPGHEHERRPFTERGRAALSALLVPVVARIGFDALWIDLHRGTTRGHDTAHAAAMARAEWWRQRVELDELHAAGLVAFRPVEHDHRYRPTTAKVLGYQDAWQPVLASAWVDGEQVGWMTDHGHLVPLDDVLRMAS